MYNNHMAIIVSIERHTYLNRKFIFHYIFGSNILAERHVFKLQFYRKTQSFIKDVSLIKDILKDMSLFKDMSFNG